MPQVKSTLGREGYGVARACVLLFAVSALLSYIYVLRTGRYNGDFLGVPEQLGAMGLTGVLALTILPYIVGWQLYKYFKRRKPRYTIPLPYRLVSYVFFVAMIWFIFLVIKYDVGVMGQPMYDAPASIKPIIQISNRINPFYLGVLFILTYKGSRKILWLGVALLITLGILREGLGVFLYVALALVVRNKKSISYYLRHNAAKIVVIALIFPVIVGQLYSLRSALRDDGSSEVAMSAAEIVSAKLVGRMSSFSNSALIFQEHLHFSSAVKRLEDDYFVRQAFGGIFGVAFIPEVTPERMLVNIYGGDYFDVSYMTGLPGNLFIAWLVSPAILLLNMAIVLVMCTIAFVLARRLKTPTSNEFAFLLLLYPLTSGVASEFSSLVVTLLSLCILFGFLAVVVPRRSGLAGVSAQVQTTS